MTSTRLEALASWLRSLPAYEDAGIDAAVDGAAIRLTLIDGGVIIVRTIRTEAQARRLIDWFEIIDWSRAYRFAAA